MLLLTVCGILVASISSVANACTTNWVAYGSKCYFASHDTESWNDAEELCILLGGHLAEIDDMAEGKFLSNLTRADKNLNRAGFWIGLSDVETEGTWKWMNSHTSHTAASYSNWAQGQPDNKNDAENCVWLHGNEAGVWYDDPCGNIKSYFCEKGAGASVVVG